MEEEIVEDLDHGKYVYDNPVLEVKDETLLVRDRNSPRDSIEKVPEPETTSIGSVEKVKSDHHRPTNGAAIELAAEAEDPGYYVKGEEYEMTESPSHSSASRSPEPQLTTFMSPEHPETATTTFISQDNQPVVATSAYPTLPQEYRDSGYREPEGAEVSPRNSNLPEYTVHYEAPVIQETQESAPVTINGHPGTIHVVDPEPYQPVAILTELPQEEFHPPQLESPSTNSTLIAIRDPQTWQIVDSAEPDNSLQQIPHYANGAPQNQYQDVGYLAYPPSPQEEPELQELSIAVQTPIAQYREEPAQRDVSIGVQSSPPYSSIAEVREEPVEGEVSIGIQATPPEPSELDTANLPTSPIEKVQEPSLLVSKVDIGVQTLSDEGTQTPVWSDLEESGRAKDQSSGSVLVVAPKVPSEQRVDDVFTGEKEKRPSSSSSDGSVEEGKGHDRKVSFNEMVIDIHTESRKKGGPFRKKEEHTTKLNVSKLKDEGSGSLMRSRRQQQQQKPKQVYYDQGDDSGSMVQVRVPDRTATVGGTWPGTKRALVNQPQPPMVTQTQPQLSGRVMVTGPMGTEQDPLMRGRHPQPDKVITVKVPDRRADAPSQLSPKSDSSVSPQSSSPETQSRVPPIPPRSPDAQPFIRRPDAFRTKRDLDDRTKKSDTPLEQQQQPGAGPLSIQNGGHQLNGDSSSVDHFPPPPPPLPEAVRQQQSPPISSRDSRNKPDGSSASDDSPDETQEVTQAFDDDDPDIVNMKRKLIDRLSETSELWVSTFFSNRLLSNSLYSTDKKTTLYQIKFSRRCFLLEGCSLKNRRERY